VAGSSRLLLCCSRGAVSRALPGLLGGVLIVHKHAVAPISMLCGNRRLCQLGDLDSIGCNRVIDHTCKVN
jgi:hypothetical protein